ncbi:hypothetical protein EMIT0373P_31031 [Pseudomonas chlororaphis]
MSPQKVLRTYRSLCGSGYIDRVPL